MLYNVLTVRNLLPVCFKRLQGQLLRLTTLRCRDEATRTPDPYVPNVVRYQLRYIPNAFAWLLVSGCKGTAFLWIKQIFLEKVDECRKKVVSLQQNSELMMVP